MTEEIELIRQEGPTPQDRARAWEKILARQEESGLTVRAFAITHGVPMNAIYYWRDKLRRKNQPPEPAFVELQPAVRPEEGCALELHAQGLHIRVHNCCEARLLETLIATLREQSC